MFQQARPQVPAAAVPARVASVAGLPPAWIGVGSIDLFVEEDMEYARRLVHAGVATELLVMPGAFHGFDLLVPDAASLQAIQRELEVCAAQGIRHRQSCLAEKLELSRQSARQ